MFFLICSIVGADAYFSASFGLLTFMGSGHFKVKALKRPQVPHDGRAARVGRMTLVVLSQRVFLNHLGKLGGGVDLIAPLRRVEEVPEGPDYVGGDIIGGRDRGEEPSGVGVKEAHG